MSISASTDSYYNAAEDLLVAICWRGAVIRPRSSTRTAHTYADLYRRARQFANVLTDLGVQAEQRIVLCMHDTVAFPVCFLGAILAGVVPIPVNTRLTENDYDFILTDSQARVLVVSPDLLNAFEDQLDSHGNLNHVLIDGECSAPGPYQTLGRLIDTAPVDFQPLR